MKHLTDLTSKTSGGRSAAGGTFDEIHGTTYLERDSHGLARLGKSQVLKRRFGFLSVFGFSCCILATWETALTLFTEAFDNGGPAGMAWGFPIAWLSSLSVYLCLAEMASIAPISGGQYFWVAILAPRRYKRFCGYITGWLTSIAWIATLAVGSIFTGTMIQGLIILNYPDYEPKNYHGTFLAWAVIAVSIFVNTVIAGLLPVLEGLILLIHILGFFAIMIPLIYLSPKHHTPAEVFFRPLNEGKWPTQGLSLCIGFVGNVATFVGADAAVHMSEEIENAALNVPRAIFTTIVLNGSLGYAMILAVLFCLGDIGAVVDSETKFPFLQVFYHATGRVGANIMATIVIAMIWCAVIGFAATASRMTWSFARDHGLPFHRIIRKVDPRTRVPIIAVGLVNLIPCLLSLIYIGSSVAYNDVISMSVSGLYASYLLPCSFLLWRRVTGQIRPHRSKDTEQGDQTPAATASYPIETGTFLIEEGEELHDILIEPDLEWGPWSVPGWLGIANNIYACVFCGWVLFWSFWPPKLPVTAESMNYSSLVTGTVIGLAIIRYFSGARLDYRGPLIEAEVKSIAMRNR